MKKLLSWSILALTFTVSAVAQATETFDIATFMPPAGWKKQEKAGAIIYTTSDESKGTYALITLTASGESIGNAKNDFESDWQEFVVNQLQVNARPEIEPEKMVAGWKIITGGAAFQNNLGPAAVLMSTYSGNDRKFSVSAMFNSREHLPAIEAFASSIKLKKTEPGKQLNAIVEKQQPQAADNRSGSQLTQFFWKQSQSRKDIGGYAGYSRNTYHFNANGTYEFLRVDFQNYAPKYYLEKEEGTYKIAGNRITITPRKAVFSSHKSTKEDPPLRTGNLGLAAVQYSFEFMDLHNNGRWSLLLSPVDGIETKRDGGFSFMFNGESSKTYSYSAVNAAGELVP